jgi:A/G-specific adenine glycosylase
MKINGKIRGWYEKNKRDLPWRHTRDPYRIWVSEVILQQTRVSQGLDYYNRFIESFPDVGSLAGAGEDAVLKQWQGLGYYSRARNLHHTAREIAERHSGRFPGTYDGLLELKGVGACTAAAIASICYGEARAVVDGNVSRVIARLSGLKEAVNSSAGIRAVESLAGELLEEETAAGGDPGTHNQSMMEFGALRCLPASPLCTGCPLSGLCKASLEGEVETIPVKIPGRKPVERRIYFYIPVYHGDTWIIRRDEKDIWRSLYQFPAFESGAALSEEEITGRIWTGLWAGKKRQPGGDGGRPEDATPVGGHPEADTPGGGRPEDATPGEDGRYPEAATPGEEGGAPRMTVLRISKPIRHQLTHQMILARFIHAELGTLPDSLPPGWIRVPLDRLDEYPFPRLIHRYMESVKF